MKLRTKFLFFGLIPIMALQALVLGLVLRSMYQELLRLSIQTMRQDLQGAAQKIDTTNVKAVTVAQVAAIAQQSGQFSRRGESAAFLKQTLEAFPEFTGFAIGYEPNGDGQDAAFRAGTAAHDSRMHDDEGRFIPYWFRDRNDTSQLRIEALHDMETSFYYRAVRNRFLGLPETTGLGGQMELSQYYPEKADPNTARARSLITEPYNYDGKLIVETSYPIVIGGKFKGVTDVDRALTEIQQYLAEAKPFASADWILLSSRGRVIAATMDPSLVTKTIEQTPFSTILRDAYLNDKGLDLRLEAERGRTYYYAGAPIPTGRWTLVLRVEKDDLLGPLWKTLRQSVTVAGLGTVALLAFLLWMIGKVTNRLERAADAAARVAKGDLTVKLEGGSWDESGLLVRSIRDMIAELNGIVGQVKRSSIHLVSSATQIAAASRQQEKVAANFGSSTSEIAAAVKEISATSQELVGTMEEVTAAGKEATTMVEAGRSNLISMEGAMAHLAKATRSISTRLAVINDRANKISQVVTTIGKVAEQTNLLSLNAAIEAEKAGEYGLGFGVVAREIRRLADQTAVASLDIERMVKEMQSSVSSGVMEMDKFSEEVRQEVEQTRVIHDQFTQIIEKVEALPARFEMVHQGMQAQSQGARQIADAMTELTEAAHQSGAALKEFKEAAGQLHETVRALQEEVARFKVEA